MSGSSPQHCMIWRKFSPPEELPGAVDGMPPVQSTTMPCEVRSRVCETVTDRLGMGDVPMAKSWLFAVTVTADDDAALADPIGMTTPVTPRTAATTIPTKSPAPIDGAQSLRRAREGRGDFTDDSKGFSG